MQTNALKRAGRALELIAARHAGKLPGDVLAEVLGAAIEIQQTLDMEEKPLAHWKLEGTGATETMRPDGEGKGVCDGGAPVGRLHMLHTPEKPLGRARRKKQSN